MLLARNSFSVGEVTEAIETLTKACQLSERIEDKDLMAEIYRKMSEYYLDAGKSQKSKEWAEKIEQLSAEKIETGKEWIY
ncbi:hypothetical protein HY792_03980 [Candidatus Desantisbacteria bacterium]|nr:hypothetical protein [Candidatus Desantisbacteria bacterium]